MLAIRISEMQNNTLLLGRKANSRSERTQTGFTLKACTKTTGSLSTEKKHARKGGEEISLRESHKNDTSSETCSLQIRSDGRKGRRQSRPPKKEKPSFMENSDCG